MLSQRRSPDSSGAPQPQIIANRPNAQKSTRHKNPRLAGVLSRRAGSPVPEVTTEQNKTPNQNKPNPKPEPPPVGATPRRRPNPRLHRPLSSQPNPRIRHTLSFRPEPRRGEAEESIQTLSPTHQPNHQNPATKWKSRHIGQKSYPSYHETKPLPRKTNPIHRRPISTQPLLPQRFTMKNRPAPLEKTNPIKPNLSRRSPERSRGKAEIPIHRGRI